MNTGGILETIMLALVGSFDWTLVAVPLVEERSLIYTEKERYLEVHGCCSETHGYGPTGIRDIIMYGKPDFLGKGTQIIE